MNSNAPLITEIIETLERKIEFLKELYDKSNGDEKIRLCGKLEAYKSHLDDIKRYQ